MNIGFPGEGFPYTNFHDMNLDWMIKIAKDFLDQYTHIQEVIAQGLEDLQDKTDTGLEALQDKYDTLSGLLQDWYDEHSQDIADQLADALEDLNDWYTEHQGYLDQYLTDSIADFQTAANERAAAAIETIPGDYTDLYNQVQSIQKAFTLTEHFMFVDGELYELDTDATFEQGNFTSGGDSSSTIWIRTPANSKLNNDFVIYNPYRLQYAVARFYGNKFVDYIQAGTDLVESVIYRDMYVKVQQDYRPYEYRLRVAYYLGSADLTPAANTLRIFRRCHTETKGVYRVINPAVGNGCMIDDTTAITPGDNYRYTDVFKLRAGETLHFEYAGPSNLISLSKWIPNSDPGFAFDSALIHGDGQYHVAEYTTETDVYLRISTMVYHVNNRPYTDPDATVSNIIIFTADNYYDKEDPLYGKTITVMGDSLTYGSYAGPGSVWLQRLALKHNMTAYNMGINGNAITDGYGYDDAMCVRYSQIPASDYIVIEGGANDKGGGAPIGTFWEDEENQVMNTDTDTFMGALNTIITGIRDMYPKAKLLFLTDYNRYASKFNGYVEAMKTVCSMRSVPCFDDFSYSGVAVVEDELKEVQDEGYWLGITPNAHFTPYVYKEVLLPKYENILKNI